MKITATRRQPEDGIDAEHIRQAAATRGYQLIAGRLRGMLLDEQSRCAAVEEPLQIYRAQGAAAAIIQVLGLPESMVEEITRRERGRA